MSEWIGVNEKLPSLKGHYRIKLDDGSIFYKAYFHPRYGWSRFWQRLTRVAYWMPHKTPKKRR